MINPELRPLSDRERVRIAAKLLADYATWQLATIGPIYPRPFDGYRYAEHPILLVHAGIVPLPALVAEMSEAMALARADGLVIGCERFSTSWEQLQVALGRATPRGPRWHQPLQPWLGEEGQMWLVPHRDCAAANPPSFRLVARRLVPRRAPWTTEAVHRAGFLRADRALARAAAKEGAF